jgi:hypothetical protein
MRKALILIGLLASCGVSIGQTIHINDFDYFVGCFERTDPQDRESIDCSKFIEWHIMKPDSLGRNRGLSSIEYSKDKHWVYDWEPLSSQHKSFAGSKYRQSSRGLQFYILMDFFGHERKVNVLTAWERTGRDSLRYHCGQVGGFDSFIGSSRIEKIRTLPDSSILLVVKTGGEGYSGYNFFRGSTDCDFVDFYNKRWGIPYGEHGGSYTNIHYNFQHLRRSSYRVTEVSEFITIKSIDPDYYLSQTIVDSASVRIIDLWEMAKRHFDIKTE